MVYFYFSIHIWLVHKMNKTLLDLTSLFKLRVVLDYLWLHSPNSSASYLLGVCGFGYNSNYQKKLGIKFQQLDSLRKRGLIQYLIFYGCL